MTGISCLTAAAIFTFAHLYYSVLKFFTGFSVEALYVLDSIVINPISNSNRKPDSKVPAPTGTLLGKFCKNIFDKIAATGNVIIPAIISSRTKPFDSIYMICITAAPITFRMLISFCLVSTVYITSPSNPSEAIVMVIKARKDKWVYVLLWSSLSAIFLSSHSYSKGL